MPTEIQAQPAGLQAMAPRLAPGPGCLILNADDWGRDRATTDRTLECYSAGSISSVSAMVFMEDSERAAEIAHSHSIDAGLHLNLTAPFTAISVPAALQDHQQRISRYLLRSRLSQVLFHPSLEASFAYVVAAQRKEFARLYGREPGRIDGHHHMHLCMNVMLGNLLPVGTVVRRHFSFEAGEKSWVNRFYRGTADRALARHHQMVDRFFSLPPLESVRLNKIFSTARNLRVEVETHPINPAEHEFLTGKEIWRLADNINVSRSYSVFASH
jgi:chitin disaccharide deacetylase